VNVADGRDDKEWCIAMMNLRWD